MTPGIWILGDQLNPGHPALMALEREHGPAGARAQCRVLLIETGTVLVTDLHHRQKLILFWSAMRHFAAQLRGDGWIVDHREAMDVETALGEWIACHGISELRLMEPAERAPRQVIEGFALSIPLHWHDSNAFLWSREAFSAWARPYRQLRMELFYREGRRRFGVLMDAAADPSGSQPLGGQWNYDHENRKAPPRGLRGPEPLRFTPDAITSEVIAKVERLTQQLPGRSDPFTWAVTRDQALAALDHFIATRLAGFGPYQDAMVSGQPSLWHSLLSPYLNLGLLQPLEVIRRLEREGLRLGVPLASLEGVIRQILGWREYTNGLYWLLGAEYALHNHYGADRPLPAWMERLGGSGMACIDTVLEELAASGYAHHIQRLMVLSNYGLIAGLDPQALTAWFLRMFVDAHDWVMQTNVIGMGLFADGGLLASKPYAASGAYINRMSTYCKGCRFNVKARSGADACPFNSLYWDFLARHRETLTTNPRMALMIRQLQKLPALELEAIRSSAASHLEQQTT